MHLLLCTLELGYTLRFLALVYFKGYKSSEMCFQNIGAYQEQIEDEMESIEKE